MPLHPSNNPKLIAVNQLREYDHVFLSEEGVKHFADMFGLKIEPQWESASPNAPKGLTLDNDAKAAKGMGAHTLAARVCDHFDVAYEVKYGRGSQLRACCDALEKHFSK